MRIRILNLFRISDLGFRICPNKNGIALIIVVSIMAVLASIAAAFSYSMIMDQRAAANYMSGIKADYIAKAGIQHAIGVLKLDGDPSNQPPAYCSYEGYDWYGDDWGYDSTLFGAYGADADSCVSNDDDVASTGAAVAGSDSRWVYLTDSQGHLIGRYAVLVIDESGKININTGRHGSFGNEGWTTGEINIKPVCDIAGVSDAKGREIIKVRYGTDGCAGISGYDDNADSVVLNNDGIDNDGDSFADEGDEGVDDSAEFYIARPYTASSNLSADTPYLTPAEVVSLADVTGSEYSDFDSYITTFSSDKNLTDSGLARLNINAVSSAMELYSTLRDAFDYWGTSATTAELAQMAVNIIDFRDRDNGSTRIDIEGPGGTVLTRYGVEGIRINEVMVRPVFRKDATSSYESLAPAGGWSYSAPNWGSTDNNDSGMWMWSGSDLEEGSYKLKIFGSGDDVIVKTAVSDDTGVGYWKSVGAVDLTAEGTDADTIIISSNKKLHLEIKTPSAGAGPWSWYRIELSQSPDCEYVELVNISENAVTMNGWHLEFPNGQVGTIPSGTSIAASGGYCVLAVDMADSDVNNGAEVYNNGIYFTKTYPGLSNVYQLGFTNDVLDDIISDTVLIDSPLRLYDDSITPTTDPTTGIATPAGHIVDQVLWDSSIIQDNDFYSMERDDPAYVGDDVLNDSGIFDTWLISANTKGSPAAANNGAALTNIKVKNSPFANIGEVADVSFSREKWVNIGNTTEHSGGEHIIRNIADRITVSGRRLDAEFADLTQVSNWTLESLLGDDEETKRKYGGRELNEATDELYWFKADASASTNEDTWTWYTTIDRFEADTYIMYVYGREGGAMRVRVDDDTALITPSTDYGARFGQVVVSDTTLSVAIQADASSADSVFFDYVLLTPASKTYGRININTASVPVLNGLKNIGASTAQKIIDDGPFQTIGHLVTAPTATIGTTTFQPISNLITTKSNVFKIICTGQSVLDKNGNGTFDTDDEVLGERKITVIYER
ncbi:MAG: type II secretion system protein GspK [bacterium]|nr:type II secretion system protein GspK [bacterium]